jgi:hypothetical protein
VNFDFWSQEWPIIVGAPHIALGGAVVIILVMFAIFTWAYRREIASQKAEISALNERLRLADAQQKGFTQYIEKLVAQQRVVNQQIEQKATIPLLAGSTATVTGTIADLAAANSVLGSTLERTIYVAPGYSLVRKKSN